MRKTLTDLWRGALDLIVPPVCWICEAPTDGDAPLCTDCHAQLTNDSTPVCPRCASSLAEAAAVANVCPRCLTEEFAFDGVVRLGPYTGAHREIVLRFKHERGEVLAEAIAPIFARQLAEKLLPIMPNLVIPVPLHWRRRMDRGYNQSEVLARAMARTLQIEYSTDSLRRVKNTPKQAYLDAPARRANVRGAFEVRKGCDLAGRGVILVDDVLTTGATANEAASMLRKAGATRIVVAVFAHGSDANARKTLLKGGARVSHDRRVAE